MYRNFRELRFSFCQECQLSVKSAVLIESQRISANGTKPRSEVVFPL